VGRGVDEAGPQRIVLVGFMGSGKSTVAPLVAQPLGWGWVDMDDRIVARAGLSIAEIFRQQGETPFRELEREVAEELSRLERHVLAAGGGAFSRPATRAALQQGAVSVWLRCELKVLLSRIPPDGTRPLAGSRETIVRLFAEREPSYRLADVAVDASAPPEEVARLVLEAVGKGPRGTSV